jgi:hypothetical protein
MTENSKPKTDKFFDDEFNPLSCLAAFLYYPALGIAIRLGFAMYGYLFDNLKGYAIILGILVTLVITAIFAIISIMLVYLFIRLGEIIWKWVTPQK